MGITINYRGKIDDLSEVDHLSGELQDFAGILNWDHQLWTEDWSQPNTASMSKEGDIVRVNGNIPIRGITLYPHEKCEPLSITFSKEGYLASSITMVLAAENRVKPDESWQTVKTQFAPIDTHIAIIKLLRFIKTRYISNLEVVDEGCYWQSDDINELESRLETVADAIDTFEDSLKLIPRGVLENKSPNEIADFIEELIRKKFRG